jgi:hypothetical protein
MIDPLYPMGKVWHASHEILSMVRHHGETPEDAFNIIAHEYPLTGDQIGDVWERVLVELEDVE